MYIQLTDRCNMKCSHCAFSCGNKGTMMPQEVFDKCLELAADRNSCVTFGGGEPTLHPQLIPWIMQAVIALVDVTIDLGSPAVTIITNGKKSEVAIQLAKLSKAEIISAELSQDEFHERIAPEVITCFKRLADIRDVTFGGNNPVKARGRAASYDFDYDTKNDCACPDLFITPNGDFYRCGCKGKKLGNILFDSIPEECWEGECSTENEVTETA